MDEAAARAWVISTFDVSRETLKRLGEFVVLLAAENERQNLVSTATLATIWNRHVADSLQLLLHRRSPTDSWLDLGTGAGFPGLLVALFHAGPVTLVEPRRLRVDFLQRAAAVLGVRPTIVPSKIEKADASVFDVVSARALAPLDRIFPLGERFATANTRWVLPKGRNAKSELAAAETLWQGEFRLEPSITDADAHIVVAEQVRRKHEGRCGR